MRPLSFAALVSFAAVATPFVLTTGCDQLNKPLSTSSSSSSSGGRSATTSADGGDDSLGGEGGAPAPTITAQPGDIQL